MSQFKITKKDLKKYPLPTKRDYLILRKIYQLEEKKLSAKDKEWVKFIRSQLQDDWRATVIKLLNKLLKKYK